ncbi:uncharacterized protein LOC100378168 isoform X3 [Saccoglossus kowalevskii]
MERSFISSMASGKIEGLDAMDDFTFLDILNKEEKEVLLNKKIEDMKKKNERLMKRHQEIEDDKKYAIESGAAVPHHPGDEEYVRSSASGNRGDEDYVRSSPSGNRGDEDYVRSPPPGNRGGRSSEGGRSSYRGGSRNTRRGRGRGRGRGSPKQFYSSPMQRSESDTTRYNRFDVMNENKEAPRRTISDITGQKQAEEVPRRSVKDITGQNQSNETPRRSGNDNTGQNQSNEAPRRSVNDITGQSRSNEASRRSVNDITGQNRSNEAPRRSVHDIMSQSKGETPPRRVGSGRTEHSANRRGGYRGKRDNVGRRGPSRVSRPPESPTSPELSYVDEENPMVGLTITVTNSSLVGNKRKRLIMSDGMHHKNLRVSLNTDDSKSEGGTARRTVQMTKEEKERMEREERRKQNIQMMDEELKSMNEGSQHSKGYSFLEDKRRSDSGESRRHIRNWGGASFDNAKVQVARQHTDRKNYFYPGAKSQMDMTMSMTGRERKEYSNWKAEREQIDNERILRHKRQSGEWKREWDREKNDDNTKSETRPNTRDQKWTAVPSAEWSDSPQAQREKKQNVTRKRVPKLTIVATNQNKRNSSSSSKDWVTDSDSSLPSISPRGKISGDEPVSPGILKTPTDHVHVEDWAAEVESGSEASLDADAQELELEWDDEQVSHHMVIIDKHFIEKTKNKNEQKNDCTKNVSEDVDVSDIIEDMKAVDLAAEHSQDVSETGDSFESFKSADSDQPGEAALAQDLVKAGCDSKVEPDLVKAGCDSKVEPDLGSAQQEIVDGNHDVGENNTIDKESEELHQNTENNVERPEGRSECGDTTTKKDDCAVDHVVPNLSLTENKSDSTETEESINDKHAKNGNNGGSVGKDESPTHSLATNTIGTDRSAETASHSEIEPDIKSENLAEIPKANVVEQIELEEKEEKSDKPDNSAEISSTIVVEHNEYGEKSDKPDDLAEISNTIVVEQIENGEKSDKLDDLAEIPNANVVEQNENGEKEEKSDKPEDLAEISSTIVVEKNENGEKSDKPEDLAEIPNASVVEQNENGEKSDKLDDLAEIPNANVVEQNENGEKEEKTDEPENLAEISKANVVEQNENGEKEGKDECSFVKQAETKSDVTECGEELDPTAPSSDSTKSDAM